MKDHNKIPAFTLGEMIIVLILTSLVVGLAFTILSLVQKQMIGIQSNFNTKTEQYLFEQSLWLDFNRFNTISYDDLEDQMTFSSEIDTTVYQFKEDLIIKGLDTFNMSPLRKTLYFEGKEIKGGAIDAIKIQTSKTIKDSLMFVFKRNDANVFMK